MQIQTTALTVFFVLFSLVLFGQKTDPNYALKRSVYDGQLYIQFHILDPDDRSPKLRSDKFYTWTKAQQINQTQGGASGDLLNGLYSAFYADKQLASQGAYKGGLKVGRWTTWNAQGHIIQISHFKKGKKRGKETIYSNDGTLLEESKYCLNGVRREKGDSLFVSHKTRLKQVISGENGQVEQLIRTKDDLLHGKQFERLTDSTYSILRYRRGELRSELVKTEKHPVKKIWSKLKPKSRVKKEREAKLDSEEKQKEEKGRQSSSQPGSIPTACQSHFNWSDVHFPKWGC